MRQCRTVLRKVLCSMQQCNTVYIWKVLRIVCIETTKTNCSQKHSWIIFALNSTVQCNLFKSRLKDTKRRNFHENCSLNNSCINSRQCNTIYLGMILQTICIKKKYFQPYKPTKFQIFSHWYIQVKRILPTSLSSLLATFYLYSVHVTRGEIEMM